MKKLAYAIVFVSDMNRSIAFYRDVLGLSVRSESPKWTEFATRGCTLALHLAEEASSATGRKPGPAGRCQPGFHVVDLDAFHARMVECKATCLQPPRDEAYGVKLAIYADPDGLPISIAQTLAGAGSPSDGAEEVVAGARKIRILVVDDHAVVRQGISTLLREQPDFDVVGQAEEGERAVEMTRELRPDVIVMDVSMPWFDGFGATTVITREFPGIRIIGLSMHDEGEIAEAMRLSGAAAYLNKDCPSEDLFAAIRGNQQQA
jgi:CheY-like chemotaxis protein/catechol 2,3-dioxygenase-like lactoylglutathione lyase family enzyme